MRPKIKPKKLKLKFRRVVPPRTKNEENKLKYTKICDLCNKTIKSTHIRYNNKKNDIDLCTKCNRRRIKEHITFENIKLNRKILKEMDRQKAIKKIAELQKLKSTVKNRNRRGRIMNQIRQLRDEYLFGEP